MGVQTRLSGKGQCVIPRDVRDRLGWKPGDTLEIIELGDGLTLRRRAAALERLGPPISWAEFRALVPPHEGPPLTLEDIEAGIRQGYEERAKRALGRG